MNNHFKERNMNEYTYIVNKLTTNIYDNKLYNKVISFLQHDEWYTKEQLSTVAQLSTKYSYFTKKQLDKINNPPSLQYYNQLSYCLYNDRDGILDIDRYQGHGEWDMSPGTHM